MRGPININYSECFKVLSTFSNDKTPGNDGLTIEFYKFFWSEIGTFLVDSLNYAHFHGELSHSQKQAVITLIEKKDKDRRWIKNWRPISLVNVDVKIGSKAIAKRLENVLPHIIHYDQNAFVKGRTIFDATRTISDVLEFTKMRNYQGIMTAIDFEKAFDSLNWNFLHKSLEFFALALENPSWGGSRHFIPIYQVVLTIMVFPLPLSMLSEVFVRVTHSRHLCS